jgi:MarR family 2-MHQ and catechol resistance regulon transcriptional repressor
VTLRDDARLTAFGLLAEAFLGVSAKLEEQLAAFDLRPLEFEVVLRLGRSPGSRLRMSDLATQAHITTSGITRIVDRLEQDGLVRRVACPTDRRGSFAELTDAGHARLDAILPGHLDVLEEWFYGRLSASALIELQASLRTIRDAVRPGATAGIEHGAADNEPAPTRH